MIALYRLAAEQGLDAAQYGLGRISKRASSLRFYQLAAAQGYPHALFEVAYFYERYYHIPEYKAEAIRLYRRALAAGDLSASEALHRLDA